MEGEHAPNLSSDIHTHTLECTRPNTYTHINAINQCKNKQANKRGGEEQLATQFNHKGIEACT